MLDAGETAIAASTGKKIPGVARTFAIANQKGGVGKTTTAINLGTALASLGRKVLIIDLDPQGNASTGLGIDRRDRSRSTYELLHGDVALEDAVVASDQVLNLSVVPSTIKLSGADAELMREADGRYRLRNAIEHTRKSEPADGNFDYILIDCPPSLNLLTVNALAAADAVLVPLQCEFFALEGLSQLLNTFQRVRKRLNPDLELQGVILTMFDKRHRSCEEVAEEAREFLGKLVYPTIIPRNVKIAEAPSHGQPVLIYDTNCPGSEAYIRVAAELLERENDAAA